MATLRSFVHENDFPHLLTILRKIHNGDIRDTSVVMISGGYSSGKTTLLMIMRALRFGNYVSCKVPENNGAPSSEFNAFRNTVAYSEFEWDHMTDFPKIMEWYHKHINLGMIYRPLHSAHIGINNPATLIVTTLQTHVIQGGREHAWAEASLPTALPGPFRNIPIKYMDEPESKHPRYPVYIHLPFRFRSTDDIRDIVNICIKEFYASYAKL